MSYYDRLDRIADKLTGRFGRQTSLVIGLFGLIAAAIYVRPAVATNALGRLYAELSTDPFGLLSQSDVSFRFLTPLLSFLLGLKGELIIITNLLFAGILIAVIYDYFAKNARRSGDPLIAAAIITFSLTTLTTIYYGGYTDSTTYLIIFLMYRYRSRRPMFYGLFLVGLFNRESILFVAPWFGYLAYHDLSSRGKWVLDQAIGWGIALALYIFIRRLIDSDGQVAYNAAFYLKPLAEDPFGVFELTFPFQSLGLFTVFKLIWTVPIIAGLSAWKSGDRRLVYSMVLLLVCVWVQMFVAYDSSRMMTLGFIMMIPALDYLFVTDARNFRRWISPLLLINLLVPQLYTVKHHIEPMYSTLANLIARTFLGKAAW